jgi:hypothetical protein
MRNYSALSELLEKTASREDMRAIRNLVSGPKVDIDPYNDIEFEEVLDPEDEEDWYKREDLEEIIYSRFDEAANQNESAKKVNIANNSAGNRIIVPGAIGLLGGGFGGALGGSLLTGPLVEKADNIKAKGALGHTGRLAAMLASRALRTGSTLTGMTAGAVAGGTLGGAIGNTSADGAYKDISGNDAAEYRRFRDEFYANEVPSILKEHGASLRKEASALAILLEKTAGWGINLSPINASDEEIAAATEAFRQKSERFDNVSKNRRIDPDFKEMRVKSVPARIPQNTPGNLGSGLGMLGTAAGLLGGQAMSNKIPNKHISKYLPILSGLAVGAGGAVAGSRAGSAMIKRNDEARDAAWVHNDQVYDHNKYKKYLDVDEYEDARYDLYDADSELDGVLSRGVSWNDIPNYKALGELWHNAQDSRWAQNTILTEGDEADYQFTGKGILNGKGIIEKNDLGDIVSALDAKLNSGEEISDYDREQYTKVKEKIESYIKSGPNKYLVTEG